MRRNNIILAVVTMSACGGGIDAPLPLFSPATDSERVFSEVAYDTLWAIGGPGDTLLAMPAFPRAYGNHGLVFFDIQSQSVRLLGDDGTVSWSYGKVGEGPGELLNVRAIDVRERDGAVILVDSGNQRVLTLNSNGEIVDEVPLSVGGIVHSVSVLSDDDLALFASREPHWQVWNRDGIRGNSGAPDAMQDMSFLQFQGRTTLWKSDKWVFGLGLGNGWFVFQDTAVIGVYPFVEHTQFAEIRTVRQGLSRTSYMVNRPPSSARSLSVRGDTLHVLFGGHSSSAGRLLDKHDLNTGQYLETNLLPHYANRAIVGANGTVFTITSADLYPRIVALISR